MLISAFRTERVFICDAYRHSHKAPVKAHEIFAQVGPARHTLANIHASRSLRSMRKSRKLASAPETLLMCGLEADSSRRRSVMNRRLAALTPVF